MHKHTAWRKSSYSSAQNACVELAFGTEHAAIRDTKRRDDGKLTVSTPAFTALLDRLRTDRPSSSRAL